MNYCIHCSNEVKEGMDICTICWDHIPAIFECHQCGQTCYKKDGDFGAWEMTEDNQDQVPICRECSELSNDDIVPTDRFDGMDTEWL